MSSPAPSSQESDVGSAVSLEVDLDGTDLIDPLDNLDETFVVDPEYEDSNSLLTVASFSRNYRVSPDIMPPSKAKMLSSFRRIILLWDDQYKDITANDIMEFQYQPTISDLTDVLAELRDIQVYFEESPADEFTDASMTTLTDLRRDARALKNAIQQKGAQSGGSANTSNSSVAEVIARKTYSTMEPTLRSTSDKLTEDLKDIRGALPDTTADFKRLEAKYSVLEEDLNVTIKQWQGLKLEAVTGKDTAAASHCVEWIQKLEDEKRLTVGSMRVTTRRMGFLPGQTTFNSTVANLSAPKFSGNLNDKMDFFSFEDRLEEYFETIGSYNPSMKLLKLKTDCLVEPALHSIRDCLSYDSAMSELRKLFGQPRVLFTSRVAEIKKLGKCPDTPVQARTWAIEMANLLKNLILLAETYKIESMFDGSNLIKTVEDSLKLRDLYKFRDKLKDLRTVDDFSLESRAKRAKYLLQFMDVIIDDASFDIDFQMTRSYKDCEYLMGNKDKERPKNSSEKHPSKKSYFATVPESSESSEEEDEPPPAKPARAAKAKPAPIFTNKSSTPRNEVCKLCKEEHSHIAYCDQYQQTMIRDRWKQICTTKACPRCMRMDAGFRFDSDTPSVREAWYNEHKLYCTDQYLCDVGHCKKRPAHSKNNITLCGFHRNENEDLMLEYVNSLDKKLIPKNLRFFFNHSHVFSAQEPPPENPPSPPNVDKTSIKIEPDVPDPAMYMLQTVKASNGADMLVFYDSGCYGAAMSDRAYSLLTTTTVRPGPTKLEVASGRVVDVEHGDEQFLLELDSEHSQRTFAAITALRLERVSNKFPEWPLAEAWQQVNTAYLAAGHTEPLPTADSHIGGREVDIMIGMRYYRYFPKMLFCLPSGLSIFKAAFKSGSSCQAVLGGTSALWRAAAETAHSMGPAAYFASELRAYKHHCNTLWNSEKLSHKPAVEMSEEEICQLRSKEDVEYTIAMSAANNKLREMLTAEDYGSNIEYRCPSCRNCSKCKNAEFYERVSLQEEREQFLIEKSVSYDQELRQVVAKLPFVCDPVTCLTDNYGTAKKVLQSQIRIACKREDGAALVVRSHEKLRSRGFVQRIDSLPPEERAAAKESGYYIPWRTVESGSLSTPLRMVFDASSKTSSGFSLNCTLAKGTNMLADMIKLLVRFRVGPFAFSADISMAYNCVKLAVEHLRYHKYLWVEDLDPNGDIVEMVVRTLIYGVKSAGNQTMVAFQVTAEEGKKVPALAQSGGPECLERSAYMDDIFSSFMRALQRAAAISGLDSTLEISKMAVKDYTLSGEPPSEEVSADGKYVSLVGYLWDSQEDVLQLDIKPLFFGKKKRGRLPPLVEGDVREALKPKFTRREMCGKVAGVYDPLGLATPVTAKLKLDLREVVKANGEWDDIIDDKFLDCWVSNLQTIQELASLKIPRCVLSEEVSDPEFEMIVCTDASQVISAATVHICVNVQGERKCLLTAAKSKLVSKMTIPRAELRACVIGACLGAVVERSYGDLITRKTYVTDSTVALSWIHADDRPLQVGVRNAVIQICRFTQPSDWAHVPSEVNPADLATRGCVNISEIGPGSEWQVGFDWMRSDPRTRPLTRFEDLVLSSVEKTAVAKEVRSSDVNGIILSNLIPHISERYQFSKYFLDPCASSWGAYLRKFALICRIGDIWTKKAEKFTLDQGKVVTSLTETDFEKAKRLTFLITSRETEKFNSKSALKDCVWKDGILTYCSRVLDTSELSGPSTTFLDMDPLCFNVPVVDRFSPVAYSIMIHSHTQLTHHGGAVSTLRESMKIAHILKGKELAVEIRRDCAFCKRYKARALEAEAGKVHPGQLCVAPAFYQVQIDLFGPVSSVSKHFARREIKAYCAVFKCTTTLAIAAFVMDSYDTTSFIDAFHRFSCMYGLPFKVMIDAGSQLVKAFKDFNFSVADLTSNINGRFGVQVEYEVCPVGNHSSHGIVERSIKEVKKLLHSMFKGIKLDLLKLETALFWVCNELNSLPMCLGNRYTNLENLDVITPARLLLGRNNQRAVGPLPQGPRPTRLARQVAEIEEAWWSIWMSQKIADLVPKTGKWSAGDPVISEGDIVVFIKDRSELGGVTWRLGRVKTAETGRDNVTRRVEIEYKLEGEQVFRSTRRSVRDVAVLMHEDELDVAGLLSVAHRDANIQFLRSPEYTMVIRK